LQYHLHVTLDVDGTNRDTAINVGTNHADDLLRYRLVFDFQHALIGSLRAAAAGFQDLTGSVALPALDFKSSDVLKGTGAWRDSNVMGGSEHPEPVASMIRLLSKAKYRRLRLHFGRKYVDDDRWIEAIPRWRAISRRSRNSRCRRTISGTLRAVATRSPTTIQGQPGVIGGYHRTLIVIPLCACVDPTVRITGMTSPERPSGTTALI
jgi:hypothetical protein